MSYSNSTTIRTKCNTVTITCWYCCRVCTFSTKATATPRVSGDEGWVYMSHRYKLRINRIAYCAPCNTKSIIFRQYGWVGIFSTKSRTAPKIGGDIRRCTRCNCNCRTIWTEFNTHTVWGWCSCWVRILSAKPWIWPRISGKNWGGLTTYSYCRTSGIKCYAIKRTVNGCGRVSILCTKTWSTPRIGVNIRRARRSNSDGRTIWTKSHIFTLIRW